MIFSKAKFPILVLLLSLWLSSSATVLGKATTPEWIINQKEQDFGDTIIYVWHDGARLVCKKFGCEIACRAPDWKVHCYNVAEKTEWIGELSQFSGVIMANPFALPSPHKISQLKEIGVGDFNGLKYTKYRTPFSAKDLVLAASEITVAEQVGEFLAAFMSYQTRTMSHFFATATEVEIGNWKVTRLVPCAVLLMICGAVCCTN